MILTALRTGITTLLVGSSNTFRTAITQTVSTVAYYKLYFHEAPQLVPGTTTDLSLPYVVWDMLPINFEWDTVNEFNDLLIQFRVSGLTDTGLTAVENIMGYINDIMKNCESTLSITGYKTIRIRPYPITPPSKLDNVWNGIVEYKLELQKN